MGQPHYFLKFYLKNGPFPASFGLFSSFHITQYNKLMKAQMVCLGLKPGMAGWKAQTNPLSYGSAPFLNLNFIFILFKNIYTLCSRGSKQGSSEQKANRLTPVDILFLLFGIIKHVLLYEKTQIELELASVKRVTYRIFISSKVILTLEIELPRNSF